MGSFFEVSRAATRRARIRSELPIASPAAMDQIAEGIAGLPDPEFLCAEERAGAMTAAARRRNQLDAYLIALAGAADRHGDSRVLHAGTTGTLVAAATGGTSAAGSAMVATASELAGMPQVAAGFAAGDLSVSHVHAITTTAPAIDDFPAIEAAVVAVASATDAGETRRILQVVADAHHPEHCDLDLAKQRAKRSLRLSARPSGMWRLTGLLDEIEGARFAELLAVFTPPRDHRDSTTPDQRRADALADLAEAAAANTLPLGVSGLSVLVDVEHLSDGRNAMLTDATPLGPESFDLLTCAAVCQVIFGVKRKGTFVPLALGRSKRRATAQQWAALVARDRGCIRCGRAPRFCQAHHILHWKNGGLTDVSNLALLCARCHHDLHHGRYTITVDEYGVPTITATRGPPRAVG